MAKAFKLAVAEKKGKVDITSIKLNNGKKIDVLLNLSQMRVLELQLELQDILDLEKLEDKEVGDLAKMVQLFKKVIGNSNYEEIIDYIELPDIISIVTHIFSCYFGTNEEIVKGKRLPKKSRK